MPRIAEGGQHLRGSGYRESVQPRRRESEQSACRSAPCICLCGLHASFWKRPTFLLRREGTLQQIVGGWETAWTAVAQSGQWFTPTFSGSDPSNTNTIGGRPDRVGDGNLPSIGPFNDGLTRPRLLFRAVRPRTPYAPEPLA